MKYDSGDIVIAPFSFSDLSEDKNRPVLLIAPLPNSYNDWLACMITSQIHQFIDGIDIIIGRDDSDFISSSLKTTSVIRVTRLTVISEDIIVGKIGEVSNDRLNNVVSNLTSWLTRIT